MAKDSEIVINEYRAGRAGRVEIYRNAAGQYHCRIIRGGRIVAVLSEGDGYTSAAKARQALRGLKRLAAAIEV